MHHTKARSISLLAALLLLLTSVGPGPLGSYQSANAQSAPRTFPETGKTVSGKFLQYWNTHGALAQQGFPISESMAEVSDTDGKTYTVQYFERAVFESHPENVAPNDVLLSLLGVFLYKQKYPAGAPGQLPNVEANSRAFAETGKHVGGLFLSYWQSHGALAQQGYPISEEFTEVSQLDGKPYRVQYFERAVFERHPENPSPYDVLLSQLGTFRYKQKYGGGPQPGATPRPAPPTAVVDQCAGVPAAQSATIAPTCGTTDTDFAITIRGFTPSERISFWLTMPSGEVAGTPQPLETGTHNGTLRDEIPGAILPILTPNYGGIWAVTYEGEDSHHQSIVWFKITGAPTPVPADTSCSNIPAPQNMQILPSNCAKRGTVFIAAGRGFQPGESVGVYITLPDQSVLGAPFQTTADSSGTTEAITISTQPSHPLGIWAITMEGTTSHAKAIGHFKLVP